MKPVMLLLSVLVWTVGCASTRYEEFGAPVEEPLPPLEPVSEGVPPAETAGIEARIARLEALLLSRLDQLESAETERATRLAALAEQVESLRAQVAELRRPASPGARPGPAPTAGPSATSGLPPAEESVVTLYDRGLTHFDEQRYGPARLAFRQALTRNPQGDLADNAQYWLGECDYAEENYTGALEAFRRVFQFARTEKDDDAQIKLGYCYMKLGDLDSALIEFKRLTVDYPKSEYLPRAEEQIRRIRALKATAQ